MELSTSHMFICNNQFLGVMRSAIIKEFHDIKLKIDFHKILSNDRQLIELVKKNCEEDHTNVDTLKLLSTDNVYSKMFNYNDCENFVKYLGFINSRNIQDDMNKLQLWIIDFQFEKDVNFFKITLNSLQVLRLFTQVNSFYSNYLIFNSILKQNVNGEVERPVKQDKKVTEYISTPEVVETNPVVTPHELISRERSELDEIFELCVNSSIKSSLIHYTFNYFKYITDKHCKILTNDKKQVQYTLPMLMPKNTNEQYFNSLILSNVSVSSNNIIYVIKKILHNLHTSHNKYQENSLYLMMVGYLLFVYLLRYLYDSNREFFRVNFKQFINNANFQNQIITKVIGAGFADFSTKVYFKIIDTDLSDVNEEYNLEKINKLSQEFQHLLPVSQQIFADKIFESINDNKKEEPKDFKLTQKKVFDIMRLIENNQKQQTRTHSVLFDPNDTLHAEESVTNEYNFLDYKLISNNGSKVITKTYQRMLDYVKNPSSILLMAENEIPKEVKNLFDIISKKVLNTSKITKDMISTFSYYNILLDCIPHPMEFKHTTFLYIIFYIIVPYHFDVYGNSQFEDVFL